MLQTGLLGGIVDDQHADPLRPEDRRYHVGTGHHSRPFLPVTRRREREGSERRRIGIGELAEAGPGDRCDVPRLVAARVDGAEEHELPLGEPLECRMHMDQAPEPVTHPVEVADHAAHFGDGRLQFTFQRLGHLVVDAIDLDLRPGLEEPRVGGRPGEPIAERGDPDHLGSGVALDEEHRMNEQVDIEPVALEPHPHRVDEERHVVGDHEHDRVGSRPAVALPVGGHHADER